MPPDQISISPANTLRRSPQQASLDAGSALFATAKLLFLRAAPVRGICGGLVTAPVPAPPALPWVGEAHPIDESISSQVYVVLGMKKYAVIHRICGKANFHPQVIHRNAKVIHRWKLVDSMKPL